MQQNTTLISPYTIPEENIAKRFSARSFVDSKNRFFASKRILDVVVSFFVITFVLSWLIPILAILIRLDSRGPVFFVQKRVGRGGRSFRCFKLRTMRVN